MRSLRLIRTFITASALNDTAYAANFLIGVFHSLLNFGIGWLGLFVVYGQIDTLRGWDYNAALTVLGVYLVASAFASLVVTPSLDQLGGMEGEIWRGAFDFTLMRPVNTQFLVSLRHWHLLALFDLLLGLLVIAAAAGRAAPTAADLGAFLLALAGGLLTLYSVFLLFTSFVFWSPGFLFSWIYYGIWEMGRFPTGIYPGFLRPVLTWVIPIGVITTIPAQALTGDLPPWLLALAVIFAGALFALASFVFRRALARYASASS